MRDGQCLLSIQFLWSPSWGPSRPVYLPLWSPHQLRNPGHLPHAENVNLYAAGNGLKAITRGSAQSDEVLKLLNLCPERYALILAQTVGK